MSEAKAYLGKNNEELGAFIKGFTVLEADKAAELRGKLLGLGLIKLNEKNTSKIIDALPEDKAALNELLHDVSMDENESNTILQTVKEYK